ncbi:MAG: branched-chain-amino-acid transaminase [Deltaproteobacteria bacterium]|nr:branched-chain-amino-acid transaminase [Deltaproteobacteria bacterium]
MKIYIDGKYYGREDARISVFDHGFLYGDGVFEGIRVYNGRVFRLSEHIERLYGSAKAVLLEPPLGKAELEEAVAETVRLNGTVNGYIRLVVTRGKGLLGIDPSSCAKASVIIIVDDLRLYPDKYYRDGIEIVTASTRRISSDSLDPRIKSLNYLNNIMAKLEAKAAGCLEAVMLNSDGFVAECTADNIFIVKDGVLMTPAPYCGALDGITMRTVVGEAVKNGIRTLETTLTRYDLYTADEAFMTGTGAEVAPVVKIDGRVVGDGAPGAVTGRLMRLFKEAVASYEG